MREAVAKMKKDQENERETMKREFQQKLQEIE